MRISFRNIKVALVSFLQSTDLVFLLFLLLFLNFKLPVKVLGLIFIYVVRRDFNFRSYWSSGRSAKVPLFYLLIIPLSIIQLLVNSNYQQNYLLLFCAGIVLWMISWLVLHQLVVAVKRDSEKVHNALICFFIFNAIVSAINMIAVLMETDGLNPYVFEGLSLKYHSSTGDFIRGITFDVSTTNMIINIFGVFYFLYHQRFKLSFVCLLVVLLTTSNMGNIIMLAFFLFILAGRFPVLMKSYAAVFICVLVVFTLRISSSNLVYIQGSFKKVANKPSKSAIAESRESMNSDSLLRIFISRRTQPHTTLQDTVKAQKEFVEILNKMSVPKVVTITKDSLLDKREFESKVKMISHCRNLYGDSITAEDIKYYSAGLPGKAISFLQTAEFLGSSIKHFLIGAGPGNFSSKFALRAVGLNTDGKWPQNYAYINDDFRNSHLKLWFFYKIQPPSEHSVLNFPNSALNQIAGDYGVAGILLFIFFYLGYFIKRFADLTYGKILLPVFLIFLCTDYWFENLSVVILFELMMFLDLHKHAQAKTN